MLALGLFGSAIWLGYEIVKRLQLSLTWFEAILYSTTIGLILSGYGGLTISYLLGFSLSSQVLLLFLFLLTATALWSVKRTPLRLEEDAQPNRLRGILILGGILLIILGLTTLTWHENTLWINNRHNYGDIRLHLAYINGFIHGHNIPIENPILSGTSPSYPFLFNFITAQSILLGTPLTWAINLFAAGGYLLVGLALFCLTYRFTQKKEVATLATVLLFLSGGLGLFLVFIPEWAEHNWQLSYLAHLTADYSLFKDNAYWLGNSIIAFFGTQRTLLLGLPITFILISELFRLTRKSPLRHYLFIGLLTTSLVLIHTSSLITAGIFLLLTSLQQLKDSPKEWRVWCYRWSAAGIPFVLSGGFLISTFLDQAGSITSFLRIIPGWMYQEAPIYEIWFKSAGPLLLLAIPGIFWLKKDHPRAALFVGMGWFLFAFGNFLVTQPWDYDNSKYLLYWYTLMTIPVAWVLTQLWRTKQRWITLVCIILLTGSGTFDLARRLVPRHEWFTLMSTQDITQVDALQAVIPPQSRVLTYGYMLNPVVSNLGRPMVFGDEAWLWSHGVKYTDRLQQVEAIYRGEDIAGPLISLLGIDYIIVSNNERTRFTHLNEAYFENTYTAVYRDKNNLTVFATH